MQYLAVQSRKTTRCCVYEHGRNKARPGCARGAEVPYPSPATRVGSGSSGRLPPSVWGSSSALPSVWGAERPVPAWKIPRGFLGRLVGIVDIGPIHGATVIRIRTGEWSQKSKHNTIMVTCPTIKGTGGWPVERIMSTAPLWAPSLPVATEAGTGCN